MTPRRPLLKLVLALALGAALPMPAAAEDAPTREFAWDLGPQDLVVYRPYKVAEDGSTTKDETRLFSVYGYEIAPGGRQYQSEARTWDDVAFALALRLPDRSLKDHESLPILAEFPDLEGVAAFIAKGEISARGKVERAGKEMWRLAADYRLSPGNTRKQGARAKSVDSGFLSLDALYNPREKIVHTITITLEVTLVYRQAEGSHRKGDSERVTRHDQLVRMKKFLHRFDDFQKRVDQAVSDGVGFLKKKQGADGSWGKYGSYESGPTAIALLTLIKCGLPRHDPAIVKGMTWLLRQSFVNTYEVGLSMMALEAWHTPESEAEMIEKGFIRNPAQFRRLLPDEDRMWMQDAADWLATTMAAPGLWGYGAPPKPDETPLETRSRRSARPVITGEPAPQPSPWQPGRKGHVPGNVVKGSGDHSNTQYAILGLDAAARCKVTVDPKVWEDIAEYFLSQQEKSGDAFFIPGPPPGVVNAEPEDRRKSRLASTARGWGYRSPSKVYASMTGAGLTAQVLGRANLEYLGKLGKSADAKLTRSIDDGFAWFYRHWSVKHNAGGEEHWYFYYLYGLERACVLNGSAWIGAHDWYWEGAMQIIPRQRDDGSWQHSSTSDAVPNTCFALLFLKRATVPVIRTDK